MGKSQITKGQILTEFADKASDPERWFNTSKNLFSTAQLLEPKILSLWASINARLRSQRRLGDLPSEVVEHQSVYLMLCAYCLENLMKSKIVENNPKEIRLQALETGLLPRQLKTHNLLELAERCSIELTVAGKGLLRRLTRHAKWIGRYPLGTSIKTSYDLTPTTVDSLDSGWSERQVAAVKELIRTIAVCLGKTMPRAAR